MSELENEAIVEDSAEYIESETPEIQEETQQDFEEATEPSELAPDSEPGHEQNAEGSNVNQDKVNEVINKKHRLWKEEQEKNVALQQEVAQLRGHYAQANIPSIPDQPDPFDDDYDTKMRERDAAIQQRAQYDVDQQALQFQQQQLMQQQQQQMQQQLVEKANTYATRAKEYGIKKEELQVSANTVGNYIREDLTQLILEDEKGPLITQYLGSNPLELATVAEMPPIQAALYIERSVKPKLNVTPKTTRAKRPPGRAGTSSPAATGEKYRHSAGAKFE